MNRNLPTLVGTLAELPDHIKEVIQAYGNACYAQGVKAAANVCYARASLPVLSENSHWFRSEAALCVATINKLLTVNEVQPQGTDPLSDFREGQWWVKELDAMAASGLATENQKRAIAVVHHMLRAARAAIGPGDDNAEGRV